MGLQWFLPDTAAADGLLGRQIAQSFARRCRSRPGCFSTCSCPSVIGKSERMAAWQTPHLYFIAKWVKESKQEGEDGQFRGCRKCGAVNFPWPALQSKVLQKSSSPARCDVDAAQRALMWHIVGHLHLAPSTSGLLLLLLFCETIHRGDRCHVRAVFEALMPRGDGSFKESKLCGCHSDWSYAGLPSAS